MVENGAQLIVKCFQVHWGIGLAFFVPVVEHFILPRYDLLGVNIAHLPLAEVRHQLCADDMLFCPPGIFFDTAFHIRCVEGNEALKGHIQVGVCPVLLLLLPGQGLPLGGEAPLLGLLALSFPVGVSVDHTPGIGFRFLVNGHFSIPFLFVPSAVADLFHEILLVDTPGNRQIAHAFQFLVKLLNDFVGVGLGNTHFLRHLLHTQKCVAHGCTPFTKLSVFVYITLSLY